MELVKIFFAVCLLQAMVTVVFSMNNKRTLNVVGRMPPATAAFNEKWGMLFDFMESNKDGIFTLEECFDYLQRLITYLNAPGHLKSGIFQIWRLYNDALETYFGLETTKTGTSKWEYVAAHGWYWSNHYDIFKHRISGFFKAIFHAMDTDDDNQGSLDEFKAYYLQFADTAAMNEKAVQVFNLIDADGDGTITETEFQDAYFKYYVDPNVTAAELPLF